MAVWRRGRTSKSDSVEFQRYAKRDDMVRALASLPKGKERIGVVAHNLDYDALVLNLSDGLREQGYRLTRAVLERGKWVQRWQLGGKSAGSNPRTLLLIDLLNFYPMPLREVGSWLGRTKGRLPDFGASDGTWFDYCQNDVEIELAALRAWLDFVQDNDLGYFAPTIAGQAFNAYRHRFMPEPIYVHVHPDVIGLERASHYGGRNQEFFRGRAASHDYVHLDCNSMYGSVMLTGQFPVRQTGHFGRMTVPALERILSRQAAIAHVAISTDVPAFPKRVGLRASFPLGQFRTVLPAPELRLATSYGYVTEVLEVVTYDQAPIFREYVRFFWRIRQEARKRGDEYMAKIAKRILAALHGKFGQRIFTSELIATGLDRKDEIWAEYDIEDSAWYEYRTLAGRLERRIREVQGRDTLVAIPATVASYARVKLWNWMLAAGLENVMYVDTDSLIVKRKALERLGPYIKPHTLGGLRIINESKRLYIRAPKWYRFGREVKRAGVSANATEVDWDKFEQDKFHTMNWSLSHDYAGMAVVEQVQISAPYRNLLLQNQLGHWVGPLVLHEDAD